MENWQNTQRKGQLCFIWNNVYKEEKKDIYPKRPFDSHLNIEPGVKIINSGKEDNAAYMGISTDFSHAKFLEQAGKNNRDFLSSLFISAEKDF